MDNELKPCPNPECEGHKNPPSYRDSAGRLVPSGHPFVTQRGRGCVYVLCGSCDMGGPSGKDRHDREGARRLWNSLPHSHPSTPPEVREALENARRKHTECEDGWYSCPKAPGGCCNDDRGPECDCGADEVNAAIDAALASLGKAEPASGAGESDARMGRHIHHLQAKLRDKRKKIRGLEVGIQRLQEERDALLGTQEDDLAALAEIQNAGPASGVVEKLRGLLKEVNMYALWGDDCSTKNFRDRLRAALAELEGEPDER